MGGAEVPEWLSSLPLAPEYRPTETEFADPIAFISRVEEAAAAFGICKVVPPIPKPSKKFVFQNLDRSLSKAPELGGTADADSQKHASGKAAVFTTRHQELGSRRTRLGIHKQVWQSGELYTLEQFEAKARAFARAHLGAAAKGTDPLIVEAMFWKATGEKPVYIEYANDVPGSGFGVPKEPFRCGSHHRRRRRMFKRAGRDMVERPQPGSTSMGAPEMQEFKRDGSSDCGKGWEGSAGWKLSNSPWNLQVIARSPGSLTRFMPDEVPGVTSPMVYIGMLFSWFAWHVEDHELHSLNFLHAGSPKTWYAVPGSYAAKFEELVRMEGYGGHVDRLAAFTLLGEKTTLLSPEVIAQSGIPCCRLVQKPGEFVVTFPRAYHVGFSHGFNCGEAANFATPKWLNVAKDAAVRRAAMNYLPMLSHQQLLYMLTMSFISRVPRDFLPGVRSSRLRDRKKEEREILVKKAFLDDFTNEHHLVHFLLGKDPALYAVLWNPDLLPYSNDGSQMFLLSPGLSGECKNDVIQGNIENPASLDTKGCGHTEKDMVHEVSANIVDIPCENLSAESQKDGLHNDDDVNAIDLGQIQSSFINNDGDLPCDFDVDSGTLACVACGILGYPFMCIVQPSGKGSGLFSEECKVNYEKRGTLESINPSFSSCLVDVITESANSVDFAVSYPLPVTSIADSGEDHIMTLVGDEACEVGTAGKRSPRRNNGKDDINGKKLHDMLMNDLNGMSVGVIHTNRNDSKSPSNSGGDCCNETGRGAVDFKSKWNMSNRFLRPRIFCLEHALEIWELLQCKGGASALIVCHSDYPKIKAHAISLAEDIDAQLDCKDVPLKNASQPDLDLIYISIDDEEHDEDGEDWTAKMGLNLRYCVKLRKQSSSNQEQLTLSLGGMFSKQGPFSVMSGLKWHCRKSRTHHRFTAPGQPRAQGAANISKDKADIRCSLADSSARIQVGNSVNCEIECKKRRGRPRKPPPRELVMEAAVTNDSAYDVSARCLPGDLIYADKVPDDDLSKCAGSKFSEGLGPEDAKKHKEQSSLERKQIKSSYVVGGSVKTEEATKCSVPALEVASSVGRTSSPTASGECLQGNENSSCNGESSENYIVHHIVESDCQHKVGLQTDRGLDIGIGQENQIGPTMSLTDDPAQLQDLLMRTKTKDVFNSSVLDEQPTRSTCTVGGFEHQGERSEHTTFLEKQENSTSADSHMRREDSLSANLNFGIGILSSEVSEIHQVVNATEEEDSGKNKINVLQSVKENGPRVTVQLKLYERRRKKRQGEEQIKSDSIPISRKKKKREIDHITNVQLSCNGFIRSPCEGLRPRSGRTSCEKDSNTTIEGTPQKKRSQRGHDNLVGHKEKDKSRGSYQCNLQGCHMSFQTGRELNLHKRNRCTYEGCGKRFISHKYAMRHQCVHDDERPLKCPWKGCNVTFKWAWARTEHVRLHTGERPYKCKAPGCGLTFRFVSDFSRHRRKTGHSPC